MSPLVTQILTRAFATLGEREIAGTGSNSTILGWIRRWFPRQADDSSLAWCAIWVATIMQECGLEVPALPFRAFSWRQWGAKRTGEPQLGDVVILDRAGGYHVGLCLRVTANSVWLLGGNQGSAVSVAEFDRARVVSVRVPAAG